MDQRRFSGHHYGYFESQVSHAPPVMKSTIGARCDTFLLDLLTNADIALRQRLLPFQSVLQASREMATVLLPEQVTPHPLTTLTDYDRLSTALTVAQVTGIQRLCRHYARRLAPLTGPDSSRASHVRLTQITQYARQLASQPSLLTRNALQQLDDVGLTTADIITFHHIIGFVSYQARALAVLQALFAHPLPWLPGNSSQPDADSTCFTEVDEWQPHLPPLELRYADARQLEALTWCAPQPAFRQIAWLLAHDASALYGWANLLTKLAENGVPGDAELAKAVTARINGSRHCFAESAHPLQPALRESVTHAQTSAPQSERAIIESCAMLTRAPERFSSSDIALLQDAGLTEVRLLSTLLCCAQANWRNRIMQTLGD